MFDDPNRLMSWLEEAYQYLQSDVDSAFYFSGLFIARSSGHLPIF